MSFSSGIKKTIDVLQNRIRYLTRFRLRIPPMGITLIGAFLIIMSVNMLTKEMAVSVPKTDRIELFLALDCGSPEISIEPILDEGTLHFTVFAYRTRRVTNRDCHIAIVGTRVPLHDLKWRESLFPHSHKEEVVIPIDKDEQGSSVVFAIPQGSGGVLEFIVEGGIARIDRARFQLDITMGHFPGRELSLEARKQFQDIAPNKLNISIVAPPGYSRESGFPEPTGGQSWSKGRIYRFSLPYVFSPMEGRLGELQPYYDQSDLSITFVSVSELERKNYFIIIWSTLLGLGVALFIDALVVSQKPKPPHEKRT